MSNDTEVNKEQPAIVNPKAVLKDGELGDLVYALIKQVDTITAIETDYGYINLSDAVMNKVKSAIKKIISDEIRKSEGEGRHESW